MHFPSKYERFVAWQGKMEHFHGKLIAEERRRRGRRRRNNQQMVWDTIRTSSISDSFVDFVNNDRLLNINEQQKLKDISFTTRSLQCNLPAFRENTYKSIWCSPFGFFTVGPGDISWGKCLQMDLTPSTIRDPCIGSFKFVRLHCCWPDEGSVFDRNARKWVSFALATHNCDLKGTPRGKGGKRRSCDHTTMKHPLETNNWTIWELTRF